MNHGPWCKSGQSKPLWTILQICMANIRRSKRVKSKGVKLDGPSSRPSREIGRSSASKWISGAQQECNWHQSGRSIDLKRSGRSYEIEVKKTAHLRPDPAKRQKLDVFAIILSMYLQFVYLYIQCIHRDDVICIILIVEYRFHVSLLYFTIILSFSTFSILIIKRIEKWEIAIAQELK